VLTSPPGENASHLKLRRPFVPTAQQLISLSDDNNRSRGSGRAIDGMQSGWTTLRDSVLSSPTSTPTLLEWHCQVQRGSGLNSSALVSEVPLYTNGVWPFLRLESVAQKNTLLTMLSFTVQSIDSPLECMSWRFWMTRQSNGYSKPAQRAGF